MRMTDRRAGVKGVKVGRRRDASQHRISLASQISDGGGKKASRARLQIVSESLSPPFFASPRLGASEASERGEARRAGKGGGGGGLTARARRGEETIFQCLLFDMRTRQQESAPGARRWLAASARGGKGRPREILRNWRGRERVACSDAGEA